MSAAGEVEKGDRQRCDFVEFQVNEMGAIYTDEQ